MNRELPHNDEAEKVFISCCLIDGAATLSNAINSGISPAMFFDTRHGLIFERLVEMLSEAKAIDTAVLAQELIARNQLSTVGGYQYLTEVTSCAPTTSQAAYFAERLRQLYVARSTIREASALVEKCYAFSGGSVNELIDAPIAKLLSLSAGAQDAAEPDWAHVVDEADKALENIITNKGLPEHMMIPFPWPAMNDRFNPMQRGQLVEIAARPSVGKSSLVRPIALHAAKTGRKVYFVTLEVNPVNVVLQMAASVARVGIRQVAKAHIRDQADLRSAVRGLRDYGITISRRDRSISRILARARALHAKGQLDMLVVDHGLLVQDVSGARADDLKLAIGRLTKGLKTIAQELGIVCVLLWQLNRASVKDGNREPNMTDLKDCGSLEEDADKILFIHRPSTDPHTGGEQRESMTPEEQPRYFQNIIQAKGRDDGTSILSFYFERATASFLPITMDAANHAAA